MDKVPADPLWHRPHPVPDVGTSKNLPCAVHAHAKVNISGWTPLNWSMTVPTWHWKMPRSQLHWRLYDQVIRSP